MPVSKYRGQYRGFIYFMRVFGIMSDVSVVCRIRSKTILNKNTDTENCDLSYSFLSRTYK